MRDRRNEQYTLALPSRALRPFPELKKVNTHRFLCFCQTEVGGMDSTGWVKRHVSGG